MMKQLVEKRRSITRNSNLSIAVFCKIARLLLRSLIVILGVSLDLLRRAPHEDVIKSNVDGSSTSNPSPLGFDMLFRNHLCDWFLGFSCYVGITSNWILVTIRNGLAHA